MSVEKKKPPVIFCVNSVKGGAGKTTFSLSCLVTVLKQIKARNAEKKPPNADQHSLDSDTSKPTARVCYVDADLLGTGARHIIYNDDEDRNFFNEETNDFASVINEVKLDGLTDENCQMYCVLLSDNPRDKNRYVNDPKRGCNQQVTDSKFLYKFKKLLNHLINDEKFDFIVIDFSPGYDTISRITYQYLTTTHKNIAMHNIVVTTTEQSHVKCTLQLIANDTGLSQDLGKMHLVVNDTTNIFCKNKSPTIIKAEFEKSIIDGYKTLIQKEYKKLTNMQLQECKSSLEEIKDIYIHDYTKFSESMIYSIVSRLDGSELWLSLENDENEICKLAVDSFK